MNKVDMNYANYKIYGKKSQSSNKNLLADMLNEIAEAVGFSMLYLREDFSDAKGYLIDEEDIPLLKDMAEIAKSSSGKRIRCKDYSVEYAETIDFFIDAFLLLAAHNGVPTEMLEKMAFQMNAKTGFSGMKHDLKLIDETLYMESERYFFAPNDFFPDEDDELTDTDRFVFLQFLLAHTDEDIKLIRGIYWSFHELRESSNRDEYLKQIHAMTDEERHQMMERVSHHLEFESRLREDEEYEDTLVEFAKIVSGQGKLQDKKKELPLAKKLCKIMDRHANGFLTTEEYAFGEPKFTKSRPVDESVKQRFMESHGMLERAVEYYYSLRAYRKTHPFTSDDENMIEYFYRQRFGENMF